MTSLYQGHPSVPLLLGSVSLQHVELVAAGSEIAALDSAAASSASPQMASRAASLAPADAAALLARAAASFPSSSAPIVVSATTPAGVALAALLGRASPARQVVAVLPAGRRDPTHAAALAAASVEATSLPHGLPAPPRGVRMTGAAMRACAREAVLRGSPHLVLPSTSVDAAVAGLTTLTGSLQQSEQSVPGAEMLPPAVLAALRPLVHVPPDVLDATIASVLYPDGTSRPSADLARFHVKNARQQLGSIPLDDALRHGDRRASLMRHLAADADTLMLEVVVDVSHWGYVVLCRQTLARAFSDETGGGRIRALDVLARLFMHVSGNDTVLNFENPLILRLADEFLAHPSPADSRFTSKHLTLPKGRTVAGVLVRPASGPSARKFYELITRRRMRAAGEEMRGRVGSVGDGGGIAGSNFTGGHCQGSATGYGSTAKYESTGKDLLVLSREPDIESSRILSRRMGGNVSALPLPGHGNGVYWDNRYVLAAAPAADIRPDSPIVSDESVLLAALEMPSVVTDPQLWNDASFYVRQLRHSDWERMTAVSKRVRWFNVPYQCIRGLPAIFQKQVGETTPGVLAAAPHLGLSGRSDTVFTAVRLPRFRCLPTEIDPGFRKLALPTNDKPVPARSIRQRRLPQPLPSANMVAE
jgi:hypothetical protein